MKTNYLRIYILAIIAFVLLIGSPIQSTACPNCKEAFSETAETGKMTIGKNNDTTGTQPVVKQVNVGNSYSLSVIFMLFVPMTIVGGIGYKIYSQAQQGKKAKESGLH